MKFNDKTVDAATTNYLQNKEWKRIYKNAPAGAQARLRVAFWFATYGDEKEDIDKYRAYREHVESQMSYEDADYLAEHFPRETGKNHYIEMREKLKYKSLLTPEKLDEALTILTDGCSQDDLECYTKSQAALKTCTDEWVKYEWLWKAAGGDGESCDLLADIFCHGHGVTANYDLAFFWAKKGALCGNGECCYLLAHFYEYPDDKWYDFDRALFWFREGIRRQSHTVMYELGARLTIWEEAPWTEHKNPKLGVELLKSACMDDEHGYAHYYLGRCYENGVGVKRNLHAAWVEYKVAEEQNHPRAEEALKRVNKLLNINREST